MKSSGIGALAERRRKLHAALGLLWRVTRHTVVEARPLGIAGIQFLIGKLASLGASPRVGSKAFQGAGSTAVGVLDSVGMQSGKEVE